MLILVPGLEEGKSWAAIAILASSSFTSNDYVPAQYERVDEQQLDHLQPLY